tara:strand:- start:315 stop:428 length:114 start_codon:yes stop_codon:yes gene_type:complete
MTPDILESLKTFLFVASPLIVLALETAAYAKWRGHNP